MLSIVRSWARSRMRSYGTSDGIEIRDHKLFQGPSLLLALRKVSNPAPRRRKPYACLSLLDTRAGVTLLFLHSTHDVLLDP
jgi:hypothetical protein